MTPASLPDAADYLKFACQLADAAAAVTLPFFRRPLPVEVKSDTSPFTIADCNSEKAMRALIGRHYPAHGIIGEEFGGSQTEAEFLWVLDPIDGTRSFISGSRQYSVMIVLLRAGMPVLSVVDFPALAERWSAIYTREHVSVRFNSAPCAAATVVPPLAQTIAVTTTVAVAPQSPQDAQLQRFLPACGHVRLGGDAYAYTGVAAGFAHIAVDYLMQPYDYLPLIPVLAAAGAVISDWEGAPLAPFDGQQQPRTVLASSSEALHQQALVALAMADE